MSISTSAIRGSYEKLQSVRQAKEEEREKQINDHRVSLLGSTLTQATIKRLPITHNGMTFNKVHRRNIGPFVHVLGGNNDVPFDLLQLRASGDQASGWMSYVLSIRDESVGFEENIASFAASKHDYSFSSVGRVATHLVIGQDEQDMPVEFQSPEYAFIRVTSGLFFPEVLHTLEAENL